MRMLVDTIRFCSIILASVMLIGLAYNGLDHLHYYNQLKLVNATPTKVLDMLNGCHVVYKTCELTVVGSDARHVPGKFNGVIIE